MGLLGRNKRSRRCHGQSKNVCPNLNGQRGALLKKQKVSDDTANAANDVPVSTVSPHVDHEEPASHPTTEPLAAQQDEIACDCPTIYDKSTMIDDTDGCTKQYRCAKALYLLSLIATTHNITIDRGVGAPGHGKDEVDGINATDKRCLQDLMMRTSTAGPADNTHRFSPDTMLAAHAVSTTARYLPL